MSGSNRRFNILVLLAGDAAAAVLALALALYVRYGSSSFAEEWQKHAHPFAWVFAVWAAALFVVGLYELDNQRNRLDLLSRASEGFLSAFLLSLALFYLGPDFQIAPKTNLALFAGIFAVLFLGWRLLALHFISRPRFRLKVVFLGEAPEVEELRGALAANPHLGYECVGVFRDVAPGADVPACDVIVLSHLLEGTPELTGMLYRRFFASTSVVGLPAFFERIRRSVPESALNQRWILRNLDAHEDPLGLQLKRAVDVALALCFSVPALLLSPLIAAAIWLEDRGPVLYFQRRVGKGGREFSIVKFRTMRVDAERGGAAFAERHDPRATRVGRFLRVTRLDELPQLWNILKGEMSFVGPRPERPEMEEELARSIPLFPVRHLCTPGLTGWAQVSFPYAARYEDHLRKLRYDLYYLKHRSLMLDAAILLKTLYIVMKRKGQ